MMSQSEIHDREPVGLVGAVTFSGDYLSPAGAETCYNLAAPGDPITIVGSPKGGTCGQRLNRVVRVLAAVPAGQRPARGRAGWAGGSTFVDPVLPPSAASAPLQTAPAGNSAAR